jgi:hypothetical protein
VHDSDGQDPFQHPPWKFCARAGVGATRIAATVATIVAATAIAQLNVDIHRTKLGLRFMSDTRRVNPGLGRHDAANG